MARLITICVSFTLVGLMFAGPVYAQIDPETLLGAWLFDEGTGTIAADFSRNGNDGTLIGGPAWVAGQSGTALEFNGSGTYVDCGNAPALNVDVFSVSFWYNFPATQAWNHMISRGQHVASGTPGSVNWGVMMYSGQETILYETYHNTGWTGINANSSAGQWHHVVATFDGSTMQLYHDGQLVGSTGSSILLDESRPFIIGARSDAGSVGGFFTGSIDEVGYFSVVLSPDDVLTLMNDGLASVTGAARPLASRPVPEDGAKQEATWVNLSWTPGDFAVTHDVYIGDNFDDVNEGAANTFQGNYPSNMLLVGFVGYPLPDGLVPGTTYYWRIDEINPAEPNSPWKGDVWSFWLPPTTAYAPSPSDGAQYVGLEPTLTWEPGLVAILHNVVFGDNFDDVNNAPAGSPVTGTSFTPGTLEKGKTYYWRVDEFNPPATVKGDVWSFSTLLDVPIADPNLVGWWKFDESSGTTVVDWSGYDNYGTLKGGPQWIIGHEGSALEFDGARAYVDCGNAEVLNAGVFSVSFWCNIPTTQTWNHIVSRGSHGASGSPGSVNWGVMMYSGEERILFETYNDTSWTGVSADTTTGQWHHVVATYDGDMMQLYHDGILADSTSGAGILLDQNRPLLIGARSDASAAGGFFSGSIDDVRIYNKVLTEDEIKLVMRGDTKRAWNPSPSNGTSAAINVAATLTWSAGDDASQHDVYFGADRDAVAGADASDTSGVYVGRQNTTSYSPPGITMGSGPFYWRIDEVANDGTIVQGTVWTFSVADYILIDGFESYNDIPFGDPGSNLVYIAWTDGFDNPNANGSTIGYITGASMESSEVHGGRLSVPMGYNNLTASVSEVTRNFTPAQDWTVNGVGVLTLWFFGDPANSSGQLYVKVNGVQVNYTGAATDLSQAQWFRWDIDLTTVGTNLRSVSSLAIGVQGAGAIGTLLFDDIALYR